MEIILETRMQTMIIGARNRQVNCQYAPGLYPVISSISFVNLREEEDFLLVNSILNRLFERKRDNISIVLFVAINKDDGYHFHERDHHETDGTCETVEHL